MTSLAMPAAGPDHGAFRWALSFALVAAAHIAAVLTLLNSPPSADSGFLAGAAVVMIDLPQAPAALPAPAFDLPPGPEMPAEQTPPLREETKPPEQTAEVALQEPEPPKPQPPVEATAPPPSVAIAVPDEKPPTAGLDEPQPPSPAVKRWQSGLGAQLLQAQRYPRKALARKEQGSGRVTFRINADGRVAESHILISTGSPELDQEGLAMVVRAQPFQKPPPETRPKDLWIEFPVNFSLTRK